MALEVERFGWSDGRLEVAGRWYGVRGRRFVRPTLELGDGRRLLAVLDHKPWAAEDGGEWIAAFAWTGPQTTLETPVLAVASGIEVTLPRLSSKNRTSGGTRREVGAAGTRFERPPRAGATELAAASAEEVAPGVTAKSPRVAAPPPADLAARAELEETRRRLDEANRQNDLLRRDVERLRRERDERPAGEHGEDLAAARAEVESLRGDVEVARSEAGGESPELEGLRAEVSAAREQVAATRRERQRGRAETAREPDEPPAVLWATRAIALTALVAGLTLLALLFRALVGA